MNNKHVGFLLLGITIIFFITVMSFNFALNKIVTTSCTHGPACPMGATLATQKIISYSLMGLLILVSLFVIFFIKDEQIIITEQKDKPLSEEEKKAKLEGLAEEEQKVMNFIFLNQGAAYQSDLVKETQLSKVKVTRILDKLEGKGLIERKRRGMTNIIVQK